MQNSFVYAFKTKKESNFLYHLFIVEIYLLSSSVFFFFFFFFFFFMMITSIVLRQELFTKENYLLFNI